MRDAQKRSGDPIVTTALTAGLRGILKVNVADACAGGRTFLRVVAHGRSTGNGRRHCWIMLECDVRIVAGLTS